MKIIKQLLFLFLIGIIFTTSVHSQEKQLVDELQIEYVTEDPPYKEKREVKTAVDPMVEIIPEAVVLVKKAPVYPGCSGENYEELNQCTRRKIIEHIGSNFNFNVASETDLTGRQQINTTFVIDSTGKAGEIKITNIHPVLKNEMIRVLESLPHIEPGEQNGEKINVIFRVPVVFQIED